MSFAGRALRFWTWLWSGRVPAGGGASVNAHARGEDGQRKAEGDGPQHRAIVAPGCKAGEDHRGGDVMAHGDKRYNSRRWRERTRPRVCVGTCGAARSWRGVRSWGTTSTHINPVYPGMPDHEYYGVDNLRAACRLHNLSRFYADQLIPGVTPPGRADVRPRRTSLRRGRRSGGRSFERGGWQTTAPCRYTHTDDDDTVIPADPRPTRRCLACNRELPTNSRPERKFCSSACRGRHWNEANRGPGWYEDQEPRVRLHWHGGLPPSCGGTPSGLLARA